MFRENHDNRINIDFGMDLENGKYLKEFENFVFREKYQIETEAQQQRQSRGCSKILNYKWFVVFSSVLYPNRLSW